MTVARETLDSLTGLRFVAALTIALGHTYEPWQEITGVGMPLFFTLSGFIIHYVYAAPFADNWWRAAREFAIARVSRIYPLYLALLLYTLSHGPMGPPLVTAAGLPVLCAYLFGYWTWWPFLVDGQSLLTWYYAISWSVSTELFFYVCYALFFYRIARIRDARRCLILLIGFCLAAYALFYALFLTRDVWEPLILARFPQFVSRTTDFDDSFYRWLLYASPYSRIFKFIGGCLTCQLFLLVRRQPGSPGRINPGVIAWIAIVATIVLFVEFRDLGRSNPWLAVDNASFGAFIVNLHMNFLFAPACYLMIFALAVGGSAVGRVLASRVCRLLGDISYSTYLSHLIVVRILVVHLGISVASPVPRAALLLTVVYLLSYVLYRIIEVPAKRWLRQILEMRWLGLPSLPGGG